jgi:hypothetical protein
MVIFCQIALIALFRYRWFMIRHGRSFDTIYDRRNSPDVAARRVPEATSEQRCRTRIGTDAIGFTPR